MKYKIKNLMKTDISKLYILGVGLICLLLIGGVFSYAMFTVSKEKSNAISIVTGNLTYKLTVDDTEGNKLVVSNGETKEFMVTLTNPNNRIARFNFYYEGDLPEGVTVGYVPAKGVNIPPTEKGINLETSDTSGSSNTYRIQVKNSTDSSVTINLGVGVGLDYNDLTLPDNGHLFTEIKLDESAKKVLADNEIKTGLDDMFNYSSDGVQFDPNDEDDGMTDPNPEYAISGIFASEDEDGVSYYYRGAVENNNVQFGQYENDYYVYSVGYYFYQSKESCMEDSNDESDCTPVKLANAGDKMYWKIIRVNGDGSLRLIYNGTVLTHPEFVGDIATSNSIGYTRYNLEWDNPKYTGYIYDNGKDSFIKKEVDTWYRLALGSSSYDSKVIGGRFCSDSSGLKEETDYGFPDMGEFEVFASYDRLGQSMTNYAKNNVPSLKCPSTNESYGGSYRLKAGLITADELVLAGENPGVVGNSYLNPDANGDMNYYWTMTPAGFSNADARVWYEIDYLNSDYVFYNYAVRPVINVTTDNMSLIGDGTLDNPYVLEEVEPTNSYKGKVTIEVGSSVDDNTAFEENLDLSGVTWTVEDSSIAKIENGKIIGLKNGATTITGVDSNGNTYEIEVTVITNPITNSAVYIGIGIILVLVLGTGIYVTYKVNNVVDKE